jgi:hypothetical protein
MTEVLAPPLPEPRYRVAEVTLTGAQPKYLEFDFKADHILLLESTADISKVYVAFNEPSIFIQLSKAVSVSMPSAMVDCLWFKWDASEEGKKLVFYYSGAPFLEVAVNIVTLGNDYVGLARESTLSSLLGQVDLKLSELRDSLRKSTIDTTVYEKTLADVWYYLTLIKAKTDNLDILLSSIKATGTETPRTLSNLYDAIVGVEPRNLTQISGTTLTGRDWSLDFMKLQNLDITLTLLAKLQRWGRDVSPTWIHGDEVTAPAAGTKLASVTVGAGKTGYIYGFYIGAGEANDFKLNWISGGVSKSIRIPFPGKGSLQSVEHIALNEGLPADGGTEISITNVNAGGAGVVYQARILYVEV